MPLKVDEDMFVYVATIKYFRNSLLIPPVTSSTVLHTLQQICCTTSLEKRRERHKERYKNYEIEFDTVMCLLLSAEFRPCSLFRLDEIKNVQNGEMYACYRGQKRVKLTFIRKNDHRFR